MTLEELGGQATQAVENKQPLLQSLSDALTKKFSQDNPLMQKRAAALSNFLASPEEAEQKYSQPINTQELDNQFVAPGQNPIGTPLSTLPIPTGQPTQTIYRSPTEQRALYSRFIANKFAPLSSLNDILQIQTGGLRGVLDTYEKGLASDIEGKKQKFDVAKALEELRLKSRGLDIQEAKIGTTSAKETAKKEALIKKYEDALTKVRTAKQLAEKGGSGFSGFDIFGLRRMGGPLGIGEKTEKLASALGQANTAWFETAGKALTPSEKQVVEIPNIQMKQSFLIQRLNDWEADLLRLLENPDQIELDQLINEAAQGKPSLESFEYEEQQ